jgi:AcrR family transcriptional regulator
MNQHSTSARLPKTARGRATREKLLQAAEKEFGERGFHAVAISDLTRTAGVALGTFYVYFDSKEAIFRALVDYMSELTRTWVGERVAGATDRISAERRGLEAYIEFARGHKGIYRIISEAEFVAHDAYRQHYRRFAEAYQKNLAGAAAKGDIRDGDFELWAWAIMGMAVFLGMRYAEWEDSRPGAEVAERMADLVERGIGRSK